jgi:hypothetical protein
MPASPNDRLEPVFTRPQNAAPTPRGIEALREQLRQIEKSGAVRRAALLNADRLHSAAARRLAREALGSLLAADRAQLFELTRGRVAVIWRAQGEDEILVARRALAHLMSDQVDANAPPLDALLAFYALPEQAAWLLDDLAEPPEVAAPAPAPRRRLDLSVLGRFEVALGKADLSLFVRRRTVMRMTLAAPGREAVLRGQESAAWEIRSFAVRELAAILAPDYDVTADPWLFLRLTRLLDRRMLALLSHPAEMAGGNRLAIHLNVASILSEEFLRFDQLLPGSLRGGLILYVHAADILADPAAFGFAARLARERGHALGLALSLASETAALIGVIDVAAAGFAYVSVKLTPALAARPDLLTSGLPTCVEAVVTHLDREADLRWALRHRFALGSGRAFSR